MLLCLPENISPFNFFPPYEKVSDLDVNSSFMMLNTIRYLRPRTFMHYRVQKAKMFSVASPPPPLLLPLSLSPPLSISPPTPSPSSLLFFPPLFTCPGDDSAGSCSLGLAHRAWCPPVVLFQCPQCSLRRGQTRTTFPRCFPLYKILTVSRPLPRWPQGLFCTEVVSFNFFA